MEHLLGAVTAGRKAVLVRGLSRKLREAVALGVVERYCKGRGVAGAQGWDGKRGSNAREKGEEQSQEGGKVPLVALHCES